MRFNILILITILTATSFFVGCTGTETPTNTANTSTTKTNSNTPASNANSPFNTTKKDEAATTNAAPTLAPIVQGYYDALQKKDEADVKKALSQAATKYWEAEMKSEKKASLLAILEDNESPVADKREVRNEKIEGDSAIAEIKGGPLGVWTPIAFVKENGEWKFDSPENSFRKLQDFGKNSNSGK